MLLDELFEVSLGNYLNKASMSRGQAQMGAMFGKDPEQRAQDLATFNKRDRGITRAKGRVEKQRQADLQKQMADTIARLPELKAEYEKMKARYKALGGSNWQYADREQNLTDTEREARAMEGPMNNLWRQIQAAEKAQGQQGVAEGSKERGQNRLWQMITDYEQRAKATKNDIKKAHYLKMASELRGKLKTSDEQGVAEGSEQKFKVINHKGAPAVMYPNGKINKEFSSMQDALKFAKKMNSQQQGVDENQGWAATYEEVRGAPNAAGAGMTAGYQRRENQPIAEKAKHGIERDPELKQAMQYAKQHYPEFADDPELAYHKWVQRSLQHGLEDDQKQFALLQGLAGKVKKLEQLVTTVRNQRQQQTNEDYLDEKWSEKYKRSIDCSNPKGFSQRAHCAGRKK